MSLVTHRTALLPSRKHRKYEVARPERDEAELEEAAVAEGRGSSQLQKGGVWGKATRLWRVVSALSHLSPRAGDGSGARAGWDRGWG